MNPYTLRSVLNRGIKSLYSSPSARLDAELLLCQAAGLTKAELITKDSMILDCGLIDRYSKLLSLRMAGMPVKYITSSCEFMGLDFYVDYNVLIPRPDTEILVESVLEYFAGNDASCIIDVGTGSGCIAISLKHYLNSANVTAVDISEAALSVAKRNAVTNGVSIRYIRSDLLNAVDGELFDCIVSNPPYIPSKDIVELSAPVRYEPVTALDGGIDGLSFYRRIATQARKALKPRGMMFLEIGFDQFSAVREILEDSGYVDIEMKKDYAGLDRVVICRGVTNSAK